MFAAAAAVGLVLWWSSARPALAAVAAVSASDATPTAIQQYAAGFKTWPVFFRRFSKVVGFVYSARTATFLKQAGPAANAERCER